MFPKLNLLQLAAMFFLAVTASAHAETHEVKMLNADPDDPSRGNVFSPEVLRITLVHAACFCGIEVAFFA